VRPVDGFPEIYQPEAVDAIVRLTRCQPYLVQLVCYEVVDRLNVEQRWEATAGDVEAVVPVVSNGGAGISGSCGEPSRRRSDGYWLSWPAGRDVLGLGRSRRMCCGPWCGARSWNRTMGATASRCR